MKPIKSNPGWFFDERILVVSDDSHLRHPYIEVRYKADIVSLLQDSLEV